MELSGREATHREQRFATATLFVALVVMLLLDIAHLTGGPGETVTHYINFLLLNFGLAVPIAIVIFCVARYRTFLSGWLAGATMVSLGEMSYSIYVVHTWTLRIFSRNQTYGISSIYVADALLRIGLAIAVTLVLAWASFRLIEVPSRRWLRTANAGAMVRAFGPREANLLSVGQRHSADTVAALILAFIGLLGICAAYQFLFVPLYGFAD
jgi:peptidoglycan/LPS O-acetylase OafA/YrhL